MILLKEDYGELPNDSTSDTNPATMDEIASKPEVSLHALTIASNLQIFCLTATYWEHIVEVLIDTRSHNNFIQEGLVEKLELQSVPAQRFCV